MAEREEPPTPDNKTPRAVRPWIIAFAVFVIVAAGSILYVFSTRFGQTATPGAAPVGGSKPSS
ncbi:hypothetical protein [Sphingomonas montana]|uniref:hypothetical protein n=1 Tax=Sphingomonas montana TaxID=1843236 RepID=UPI00096CE941|nr:hypothetical protein [Sphingomonas montana]